jgi:hypothetical protein
LPEGQLAGDLPRNDIVSGWWSCCGDHQRTDSRTLLDGIPLHQIHPPELNFFCPVRDRRSHYAISQVIFVFGQRAPHP